VKLLGKHNALNAAAAFIVCLNLGANINLAKKSLKNFSGVQRRMTKIFSKNKNDFYDDYAHHPTEISSILEGVQNVNPKRKIISIFEPHRYSRVISLKNEFSKCFSKSDLVIICPLYAAGEKRNFKFDLNKFASLIIKNSNTQTVIVKNEIELSKYLKTNLINNEIIIGMGAGSISKWMMGLKYSL
ncbi:UDP-N-acetylmuramate--L-alanine ligase, partial [Candidatus Pelagibacter bacterium]|nr:UDP-N-acetylmuramate--L-alanine ligase [Candidatus Pelagibacter bacterium]